LFIEADRKLQQGPWLLRPLASNRMSFTAELMALDAEILRTTNPSDRAAKAALWPNIRNNRLNQLAYGWIGMSTPNFKPQAIVAPANRPAMTLLLAARLYTATYGTQPMSAAVLVPAILAKIPVDPLSKTQEPMGYRLDSGGPTVWSAGANGVDDGGKPEVYSFRDIDEIFGAADRNRRAPAPVTRSGRGARGGRAETAPASRAAP
jgi:hypothetical protein